MPLLAYRTRVLLGIDFRLMHQADMTGGSGIPKILMGISEVLVVIEYVDSIGALAQHRYLIFADCVC
jgi:hypothetical protein